MERSFLMVIFLLGWNFFAYSQSEKGTISGYIRDKKTGEDLIGATIFEANSGRGVISNNYGFYSLTIPLDTGIHLVISFVGYSSIDKELTIKEDQVQDFYLSSGSTLSEIVVTGDQGRPIERRNEMSVIRVPIKDVELLPSLSGESDIIKALQLMPGVQSGSEASSNLFVRGGSPDQNLILLDDVPLYYINHLGGFVSAFNTDAIKDVKLIKGGFPAHYGSRLSSIVDIRMKDGNANEFHGSGLLGIVDSKISIEGPIKKDTTSYIISFRRMLLDLFMRPLTKLLFNGSSIGYHFYDFNAKVNHRLSNKDRLYLSVYFGKDILGLFSKGDINGEKYKTKGHFKWGNNLFSFRWNHIYNHKLFSNFTLSYTRYKYYTDATFDIGEDYSLGSFLSGIYDVSAKIDYEYFITSTNKLRFGLGDVFHTFKPGLTNYIHKETGKPKIENLFGQNQNIEGVEYMSYVEDEMSIGKHLNANMGLRFNSYDVNGKQFFSFEPRILLNILVANDFSLKASYAQMQQNIHLLTSTGTGMPIDLWMPATDIAKPEKSQQWALGLAKSLENGRFELSVEAYSKSMNNLITYKPGSSVLGNSTENWERKVVTAGKGKAVGLEFLIQKKQGNTSGWIGYTLSKSTRHFANINQGKWYPFKYDRRHDFSIVITQRLNDHVDLSGTWVYGTGSALTLAVGAYEVPSGIRDPFHFYFSGDDRNEEIYVYNGKNNYRMRDFHRLNLGINFHKKKKWGERIWNISIYNVYNRQNPFYYFYENQVEYDDQGNQFTDDKLTLKQQSLFPIIPSASYSFKF